MDHEHQAHCGCGGQHGAKSDAQHQSHDGTRPAGSALDILDERFARGEIDRAEYVEKKELISQRAPVRKADQAGQELEAPKSPPMPAPGDPDTDIRLE